MKKFKLYRLIATLSFILALSNVSRSQDLQTGISKIFQSYVDSGFTGVVLLVKDEKVLLNKGYGYSNDQAKTFNTTKTLFNVASIGKQFTAATVLKLEEQGLLSTGDLVSKYTGSLGGVKDSCTIHHLLTHSSGLFIQSGVLEYTSRDLFIASVKNGSAESKPGEKWRYSNAGYIMLAAIVEIVTKQPFEDYLYKTIFQPAGMEQTGYPWESRIKKDLLATGYDNKGEARPAETDIWGNRGPGNLVTSSEDMLKWYKAWSNESILSKTIKEKLLKDHFPGKESYSWNKVTTANGKKLYHKGGGRDDFQSQTMWWPDAGIYLFFVINRDKDLRRFIFKEINAFMEKTGN